MFCAYLLVNVEAFTWTQNSEPAQDKTYKKTYVTAKDSFSRLWIARRLKKVHVISEDFDQTARMRRLI